MFYYTGYTLHLKKKQPVKSFVLIRLQQDL